MMLKCMFVAGSNAIGCLVVLKLVGEADNITLNLTREGNHIMYVMKAVHLTKSSACISEIVGYDIESNGSIGALPVPGELSWDVSLLNCKSDMEENTPSECILLIFIIKNNKT